MTENAGVRPARWPPGRAPYSTWWLLAKDGCPLADVLTVGAGGRTLPAFGHEDEARMFLWFGDALGEGWHARQASAGELAALLLGPRADVGRVAVDPLPGMAEAGTVGLVGVDRGRFVRRIVAGGGTDRRGTGGDRTRQQVGGVGV